MFSSFLSLIRLLATVAVHLLPLFGVGDCFIRTYDGYRLFRAVPLTSAQLSALHNFSLLVADAGGDDGNVQFWRLRPQLGASTEILADLAGARRVEQFLRRNRIVHHTLVRDLGIQVMREAESRSAADEPSAEEESLDTFDLGRYHGYDSMHRYLKLVAKAYPYYAKVGSLGKSSEGREIPILTLGYPAVNGSAKPALLLDAGIHAREWIAPAVALHFVHALLTDPAYHRLLHYIDVHIVPVLNPDGFAHSWAKDRLWRGTRSGPHRTNGKHCVAKKEAKDCFGVDPNRNFPYHWDESGTSKCPCSEVYSGERPLSEPECAHLAKFMEENRASLKAYLTLHSYGNLIIHTWNFRPKTYPDNVDELRQVANQMADAITNVGGACYQVGSAPDILYSAAGGSDDYAQSLGIKYVYTMELTSGTFGGAFRGFLCPEDKINEEAATVLPGIRVLAEKVQQETVVWEKKQILKKGAKKA